MPTWNLFGGTKKSSHNRNSFGTLHRSYSADSLITVSTDGTSKTNNNLNNLTTQSSTKDIFKSVSAANAAISSNTSTDLLSVHHEQQELLLKRRHTTAKKMIVCSCICCGTSLKVPSNAPYYKCHVCDTIHDSNKQTNFIPVPLTITKVQEALKLDTDACTNNVTSPCNTIDAYPHLSSLVRNAFSCMEALNGSFPLGLTRMSYSKPGIDYKQLGQFYDLINNLPVQQALNQLILSSVLGLLKCPHKRLNLPSDVYFLLIILENPVLYQPNTISIEDSSLACQVFERSIALLSHTPKRTLQYLLNWVSRFPVDQIKSKVMQFNLYISDRLTRCVNTPITNNLNDFPLLDFFSPSGLSAIGGSGNGGVGINPKRHKKQSASVTSPKRAKVSQYGSDWRLLAYCNIMAVFFNANSISNQLPISLFYNQGISHIDLKSDFDAWERLGVPTSSLVPPCISSTHGNSIYNNGNSTNNNNNGPTNSVHSVNGFSAGSLNLDGKTGSWEHTPEFALCKYPFLFELHYKRSLLEYDARRQMEYQVQEAFFNSLLSASNVNSPSPDGGINGAGAATSINKNNQPYLFLKIRRSNLLQDSFKCLEAHETELKKRLRVEFIGEPGVDAGGLKKEWFLLVVRELFDPANGFFKAPAVTTDDGETANTNMTNDNDDARYHWFDTDSKQPLRYYQLAGVILGLAIYNSINLDINLPPVIYSRLMGYSYKLEDFKEMWPQYGNSLQQILDYDGTDEEFSNSFYGLNFTVSKRVMISSESGIQFGSDIGPDAFRVVEEPIIFNGQNKLVTKANRREFVRKVVQYYLEDTVKRQFEPLRQGFLKVAGSHALALFKPQEIHQLIRGNLLEDVNIFELKTITKYKNWGIPPLSTDKVVPFRPHHQKGSSTASTQMPLPKVVEWFWEIFEYRLSAMQRRQMLMFVTGSDRIPATGVHGMVFKITCLGGSADSDRFPIAHTCFNELCLYNYSSREKLFKKLLTAITESEGFGLR